MINSTVRSGEASEQTKDICDRMVEMGFFKDGHWTELITREEAAAVIERVILYVQDYVKRNLTVCPKECNKQR